MIHTGYEAAHFGNGSGRFLLASLDGRYLNWNVNRAAAICQVPIKILYGSKTEKGEQTAAAYRSLNPAIKTYSVPEAGSLSMLENPKGFLAVFSQAAEIQ